MSGNKQKVKVQHFSKKGEVIMSRIPAFEALKKNSEMLANRIDALDRKMTGNRKVKPIRLRFSDAEPAVGRLARDIHRLSVEVDILEGQILGHGGAA